MGLGTSPTIVSTIRKGLDAVLYGPVVTVDRFGRANQACIFDGVDDYLEIPNDTSINLKQFTVVLTFKIIAVPPGPDYASKMTIVSKGQDMGNYNISVSRFGGSSYPFVTYGHHCSIGNFTATCWENKLALNKYYQIAAAYGDNILRLTFDGVLALEQDNVPEPVLNMEPLLIGKSPYDQDPEFFNGIIDEVRLYDSALPIDELTHLYQMEVPQLSEG